MKKLLLAVLVLAAVSANAQKSVAKKSTAVAVRPLKNALDSVSYALGVSVANFYKQQGLQQLNSATVAKAINDVMGGKKALLDDQQCNSVIMDYMQKAQTSKSKPNLDAGQKFLAENKKKATVKTTASGLQYEVLQEGSGAKPRAVDTVVVNYAGTLLNGTEFDNSYKRGQPIEFPLNGVIAGWTEGLQLMTPGSKYKFYIPQELGYGLNGSGAIPPGSTLVFEVELLNVKAAK